MSKVKTKMTDYERGVEDCKRGEYDLHGGNKYIDGYADQYAKEETDTGYVEQIIDFNEGLLDLIN